MSDIVSYDRMIFARNLKRLMAEHKEKQVDIARLLGVSKAAVSSYVHGEQMPRIDRVEILARHYGVSRGALIEEGAPTRPPEAAPAHPALRIYDNLNQAGQREYLHVPRRVPASSGSSYPAKFKDRKLWKPFLDAGFREWEDTRVLYCCIDRDV